MATLSARASEVNSAPPATNAALLSPIELSLPAGADPTSIDHNPSPVSDHALTQPVFAPAQPSKEDRTAASIQTESTPTELQPFHISNFSGTEINQHSIDHFENSAENGSSQLISSKERFSITSSLLIPAWNDVATDSLSDDRHSLNLDNAQFNTLSSPELQSLPAQAEAIAQAAAPSAGTNQLEPAAQPAIPAQPASADETAEPEQPEPAGETGRPPQRRWMFSVQPYGFAPLDIQGDVTVRNFSTDFNVGLSEVLEALNFAAAGRFEAWHGNIGAIFDGAYLNLQQDGSRSFNIPDCLDCIFPSKIDTETKVRFGQFDLAVGYRIAAANPATATTEFDLGPLVFDIMVGMRIYVLHAEIDIDSNLGTSRNLSQNVTTVAPLLSARLRWNMSHNLALWGRNDIAGFGIQGLVFAWSFTSGIDWMFSGNTSLLLAYRFSSIQYDTDIRGEKLELDLFLQGPYLGIQFRF